MAACPSEDIVYVDTAILAEQITSIFTSWGVSKSQIESTVAVMVETDTYGIDSHGVSMLMLYEQMIKSGILNLYAVPNIVKESASTALIDGDAGFGHHVAKMGMSLAINKCKTSGICSISAYNSHHFGAAGYYAKMASDAGLIGLVTSSTRSVLVTPTFAQKPVLGTNPISFAAPAGNGRPFLLDMSTSTVASNKIKMFNLNKCDLPEGWVIDNSGTSITDAAMARSLLLGSEKNAGITPLGGTPDLASHKGYGLAMMVQILSATLSGGGFSPFQERSLSNSSPDNIGHFFLAIDPSYFRPDHGFEKDLKQMVDFLRNTLPINPDQPVLVAGDPEFDRYERRKTEGIPMSQALLQQIRNIASRAAVPFILVSG
jgi:LDH2 family malate/lactate/ureidoglycolate dehydrogenase